MRRTTIMRWGSITAALCTLTTMAFAGSAVADDAFSSGHHHVRTDAGLPVYKHSITKVMVIDIENEEGSSLFGANSEASYIPTVLEPMGTLIQNYYAIGHVSADNYIAQVSGQAPNVVSGSDCVTAAQPAGSFDDVTPGTLDANQTLYPGQVDGQGCVYPKSVQTIGNQLDALHPHSTAVNWREYAEDMGNNPTRDLGTYDPLGGMDCSHPVQTGGVANDPTNSATGPNATGSQVKSIISDQYADRHNPFIYFHSVIDNAASCATHIVPLGTIAVGATPAQNTYWGHLSQDLSSIHTTPKFSFITPNLCNDGHDATCAGTNTNGTTAGGLDGVNAWLSNWMPLILNSPAYQSGKLLIAITSDEGSNADTTAGDNEQPGPNASNPGYSPLLNTPIAALGGKTYYQLYYGITTLTPGVAPAPGTMPGGGKVEMLVLNKKWVRPGVIDTAGSYNHYSALRTYEDLLGITTGGADAKGHLGFASTAHDFGTDVFTTSPLS